MGITEPSELLASVLSASLDSEDSEDDVAGKDEFEVLREMMEKDVTLWWQMQRKLIKLLMRVVKRKPSQACNCATRLTCAVCSASLVCKACGTSASATHSAVATCTPISASHVLQEEPAQEPDVGAWDF